MESLGAGQGYNIHPNMLKEHRELGAVLQDGSNSAVRRVRVDHRLPVTGPSAKARGRRVRDPRATDHRS